jgi:hypothetical protein
MASIVNTSLRRAEHKNSWFRGDSVPGTGSALTMNEGVCRCRAFR